MAARWAGVSPGGAVPALPRPGRTPVRCGAPWLDEFADRLSKAWDDGKPDPQAAFERLARLSRPSPIEPAFYSACSRLACPDSSPELRAAGDRAFAIVRRACEALSALLPQAKRPPALMMALHIWALSHGIASLFARGDGSQRALPMSPEDLLEAGVLVYLSGLGCTGDEPQTRGNAPVTVHLKRRS